MLQVKNTDVILNGLNFHLSPEQANDIAAELRDMGVASEPWGFTHWSESAACARLMEAGYELTSPRQQDEAKQAATHQDAQDIDPREATAVQTIHCGNCGAPFLPEQLHKNPAINCARLCVKCLTTEGADLALELSDLKRSIEAADVQDVQDAKNSRDVWHRRAGRWAQENTKLEGEVTNLRQRLLILRDPASEAAKKTADGKGSQESQESGS